MKALSFAIVCLVVVAAFAQGNSTTTQASSPADKDTTKAPTTTTVGTTKSDTSTTTPPLPDEPKAGLWNVTNTTSKNVCILVHLGARFTLTYVNTTNQNQTVTKDLPSENNVTTAEGHCTDNTSDITLTYLGDCSMKMTFQKNSNKFSVKSIDVNFKDFSKCVDSLPSPTNTTSVTGSITDQTLFQATVGQSYLCNSKQTLNMTQTNIKITNVELVDVQVQAYMNEKSSDFGTPQECPQDAETSNIVPIAVGAALAALVLIVLIAYLISRNRGQRGYESV